MARTREPYTHMFEGADGDWHAYVLVGRKPDGSTDRRHRRAPDREQLIPKVVKLEDEVAAGRTPKAGRSKTFDAWLTYWSETIAPLQVRRKTLDAYRSHARNYLIPRLGKWRLSELNRGHFTQLYLELQQEKRLEASSIHSIHRAASTALARAIDFDEPGIRHNAAAAASKALPPVNSDEVIPLDAEEISRITKVVDDERNHARWWLAFLGPRQGEVLGMKWEDVDWDAGIINIRRQLQRHTYTHGCADPHVCAKAHCVTDEGCDLSCPKRVWEHGCADPAVCAALNCEKRQRVNPCKPGCTSHARSCPKKQRSECRTQSHRIVCTPGCTGHARHCPDRVGGLLLAETEPEQTHRAGKRRRKSRRELRPKSSAGARRMPLPAVVRDELKVHQGKQEMERVEAGSMWTDHDLIFATRTGEPIDPSADWEAWGEILDEADVEYIHLHGARHSAATFLGALGVDPVVRMAMLGWASAEMAKRYQHVPDSALVAAADQLGAAAFGWSATNSATK